MCIQLYIGFLRGEGLIADRLGGRIYISHRYQNHAFFFVSYPHVKSLLYLYILIYTANFSTAAHVHKYNITYTSQYHSII